METYCLTCKKKVEIQEPREEVMKNGKIGIRGLCPAGHKVFKMTSKLPE